MRLHTTMCSHVIGVSFHRSLRSYIHRGTGVKLLLAYFGAFGLVDIH